MKVICFDMNETLLDINPLIKKFEILCNDKYSGAYWFKSVLHASTVICSQGDYFSFGEIASSVLDSLFPKLDLSTKQELLQQFKHLKAHIDVKSGIELLKSEGYRVITISNSSDSMIKEQLENADIIDLFDGYYSVDTVQKFKPFSNIYQYVKSQEKSTEFVMVACHDWDLYGAKNNGYKTAFIQRKSETYNSLYPQVDIMDTDLISLCKKIKNI